MDNKERIIRNEACKERITRNEICLDYIKEKVKVIEKEELPKKVSITRFQPIEKIVYSLVSLILTGVAVAILNLVLK